MNNLKGEQKILSEMLQSNRIDEKIEGIKRIIISMSIGKNMKDLFQQVIKCLEIDNLKIKKMIYLYIINNSRKCPNDSLMIINQFCKDARSPIPIIRALALRTMGCLRVPKLNEYLISPLVECLNDESAYVRKTAVLCIPKVLQVSKDLIVNKEIVQKLMLNLETEKNPKVFATTFSVLQEIQEFLGQNFVLQQTVFDKIFDFYKNLSNWDQIYVLENLLKQNVDLSQIWQESKHTIAQEVLLQNIKNFEKSTFISNCKLLLLFIQQQENKEQFLKEIFTQIIFLLKQDFQTQFIALQVFQQLQIQYNDIYKNLNPKDFYCQYDDPLYIKQQKLKILCQFQSQRQEICYEITNYIKSTESDFALESIKIYFQMAQKLQDINIILKESKKLLQQMAHKNNINILSSFLFNFSQYLQMKVLSSKDQQQFLQLLNQDSNIIEICKVIDNMYTEINLDQGILGLTHFISYFYQNFKQISKILKIFKENFFKYDLITQLQVLKMLVLLFQQQIQNSDEVLMTLLQQINENSHNSLLWDQSFIYWRILSSEKKDLFKIKNSKIRISKGNQQKITQKAISIDKLGTFININNQNKKNQFLYKSLFENQRQKNILDHTQFYNSDKYVVLNKNQKGSAGLSGIEIFGRLLNQEDQFYLELDLKNESNWILKIQKIKILNDNFNIIQQKEYSDLLQKQIQKQEIHEIRLLLQKQKIGILQNQVKRLKLDIQIFIDMNEYNVYVPYNLNIILDNENNEQQNDNLVVQQTFNMQFDINLQTNIEQILINNNFIKKQEKFYIYIDQQDIACISYESKKLLEVKVELYQTNYKYLIEDLLKNLLN